MRCAALSAMVLLAAAGCGCTETRTLSWRIRFDPPALRDRAASVTARIRRGGCGSGDVVYQAALDPAAGALAPPVPVLGDGLHCFEAEALDADCASIGAQAVAVRLPVADGESVEVVIGESAGPGGCPADAGMPGRDGGPTARDAGPRCSPATCLPAHATGECAGEVCTIGSCNPGWVDCNGAAGDGCESNPQTDAQNCGSCGRGCDLPSSDTRCNAGACEFVGCDGGHGNCDGNVANGCEADFGDESSCGGCGIVCPAAVPHGTSRCDIIDDVCELRCDSGWEDCDGAPGNGCEVGTDTDRNNCGGCGDRCEAVECCSGGFCSLTC